MDELSEIQIISEDDFVDINIPLASYHRDLAGVQQIEARGRHSDAEVGFLVSLGPGWERQAVKTSPVLLYWGRAELISIGTASDAFLELLGEAYGTGTGRERMSDRVPFIAVSLEGDPSNLEHKPAKIKFFFESDAEEGDAEFYVNIDVQRQVVQFREKDPYYRRGVVLSLSNKA